MYYLYIYLELFDLVKTILKKKNKVGRLIPRLTISYSNQDCRIGIRIDITGQWEITESIQKQNHTCTVNWFLIKVPR